LLMLFVGVAV